MRPYMTMLSIFWLWDFGDVMCNAECEPTKDFSSKWVLFSALFRPLVCCRVIYLLSVAAFTLVLLETIMVLSMSLVAAVATWPPVSNGVSLISHFGVGVLIVCGTVQCLARAVTALTTLMHSSLSVPMLPVQALTIFLSANARRLVASWRSNFSLEQRKIQSR